LSAVQVTAQAPIETYAANLTNSDKQKLDDRYGSYEAFMLHPMTVWQEALNQGDDSVEIEFELPNEKLWLSLKKSSIYAPHAMMSSSNATSQEWEYLDDANVYRGFADGEEKNFAIFMIRQDHFFGYYVKDGKTWTINNLQDEGVHTDIPSRNTFVRYIDPKIEIPIECGNQFPIVPAIPVTFDNEQEVTSREPYFFEIAYDVDSTMLTQVIQQLSPDPGESPLMIEQRARDHAH
jgi:hypothetical protein